MGLLDDLKAFIASQEEETEEEQEEEVTEDARQEEEQQEEEITTFTQEDMDKAVAEALANAPKTAPSVPTNKQVKHVPMEEKIMKMTDEQLDKAWDSGEHKKLLETLEV